MIQCKPLPVSGELQRVSTPQKLLGMTDNLSAAGGVVKIWTSCSLRRVVLAADVLLVVESLACPFVDVGEGTGCLRD